MKLFCYYAFCSAKNQIKKLFRSWVAIVIVASLVLGFGIGLGAALLTDLVEDTAPPIEDEEPVEDEIDITLSDEELEALIGLICGGVVLLLLVLDILNAEKHGASIFQMADVNLLFPSPMTPQAVLLFRLTSQMLLAFFASLYLALQLPGLVHSVGLRPDTAVILFAVWFLTVWIGKLCNVIVYSLASTYQAFRKWVCPVLYAILLCVAGAFALYWRRSGLSPFQAANAFFNSRIADWIPIWGWLRGAIVNSMRGEHIRSAILLLLSVGAAVALLWIVRRLRVDFYEDALAAAQSNADRLAAAQGERTVTPKKERSQKLRRDGLRHGSGANIFFFKSVYNRFRFAKLGILTKTSATYLVLSLGVALIMRLGANVCIYPAVGFLLAGLAFFRAMGDPLAQEVDKVYFCTVPANPWAKVLWSLLGGTLDCALDILPALILSAVVLHASVFEVLAYLILALAVDLYATNVMLFIGLSLPSSLALQIHQMITVLFIYFGIVPIAGIAALVGLLTTSITLAVLAAAFTGLCLGGVFYAFSPMFLQWGRK